MSDLATSSIQRDIILERLRDHRAQLNARGVLHVALFGSRARGDQRQDSDTDILVELDPAWPLSVFDYVGIQLAIADFLDGPVDVINHAVLKNSVRHNAEADAIYAF